ncbi:hypothetical protein Gohar_022125 [Gossypium harknessii]|uniref:Retrotransposon Copia-like N-terminal domain-containing protein n=1 Tax=Gossypium harknessii TaxID=34285 RepID=A0A7J9I7Q7_9ROSI|nr:hypothetical protein [Gossypium harknessii]
MNLPSSPSTQSAVPTMASQLPNNAVDSQFFSTKKVSILLDDSNYLLWRQQVFLAVKAYKLQSFLDLNITLPPSTVLGEDGVPQENIEFASWLLSSVSPIVLPHSIGLDTSAKIWNAIVSLYGSKYTSRMMFYRHALHSQCKGDLSMCDFLIKIKSFCDSLAGCGEVISDHKHVTPILNGLPSKYEFIVSIIISSPTLYSLQSVMTMLIDAKSRQQIIVAEAPSSAHIVTQ